MNKTSQEDPQPLSTQKDPPDLEPTKTLNDTSILELEDIGSACYESRPCQHRVRYRTTEGTVEHLMFCGQIYKLLTQFNFPAHLAFAAVDHIVKERCCGGVDPPAYQQYKLALKKKGIATTPITEEVVTKTLFKNVQVTIFRKRHTIGTQVGNIRLLLTPVQTGPTTYTVAWPREDTRIYFLQDVAFLTEMGQPIDHNHIDRFSFIVKDVELFVGYGHYLNQKETFTAFELVPLYPELTTRFCIETPTPLKAFWVNLIYPMSEWEINRFRSSDIELRGTKQYCLWTGNVETSGVTTITIIETYLHVLQLRFKAYCNGNLLITPLLNTVTLESPDFSFQQYPAALLQTSPGEYTIAPSEALCNGFALKKGNRLWFTHSSDFRLELYALIQSDIITVLPPDL